MANRFKILHSGMGVVSSSAQIDYTQVQNKPTSIASASYATTASVALNVAFPTGSTKWGTTVTNTHQFTGSLGVTGSMTVMGGNVGIGVAPTGILDVAKPSTGGRFQVVNEGANTYNVIASRNAAGSAYLPLTVRTGDVVFTGSNVSVGTGTTPGATVDVGGSIGSIRGKYLLANGSLAAYASTTGGIYMHYNAGISRIRSVADNSGGNAPMAFEIGNGNAGMVIRNDRTIQINAYGAGTLITDSSGVITATSDGRMKDISGSFYRGLEAIVNLSPKVYHWKAESGLNTEDVNVGLIAQEVLPYIPEAVSEKDGRYTMSDRPIIAALINAVKELSAKVTELEAKAK